MRGILQRRPINSLFQSVYIPVFLLLCLFGKGRVRGGLINSEVSTIGTARCNGTASCVQKLQSRGISMSGGHDFRGGNDFSMVPQAAAGFDPNEPCPTTDAFDMDTGLRHVENQVIGRPMLTAA
jgi:hypothetical protein